MDWQVAIDIKIWESDFFMLEKILSYAKAKPWLKVLFAEDFSEVISMNHPNSWMIYNILSGIHIESYDKKPIDCHMSLSPNILEGLNDEEKIETEDVAYHMLHQGEPPHKLYEIFQIRGGASPSEVLTLTSDNLSKEIILIVESEGESIESYFSRNTPHLEQAKHISQQARYLGKGKIASTFKAWNQRNDRYAKELLQKAYMDSGSQNLPPSFIYTWDPKNETYVKFMHSGNWEYHGYDVENYDEIPEKIKRRYNHWKE